VQYSDHPDEVAEGVFAGLSFMEKYGVPTNPNNIAIWYAYASGKYPDVNKAIDAVIAKDKPFTEEICSSIYDTYFSHERETLLVEDASSKIVHELDRARDYVGKACENTQKISGRLKTCAEHLVDNDAAKGVRGVIEQMITETEAIGAETSTLTANLDAVTEEVRAVVEDVVNESQQLTGEATRLASQLEETAFEIKEIERGFREQREQSLTDALTGVRNRKHFDMALQAAVKLAESDGEPLALVHIDLDHFGQFNDAYGQGVGDQVLRLVARTIMECVKGQDSVGRIGGEEFGVLLPGTKPEQAAKVAENIRSAFGRKTLTNRRTGETYGTITLTAGIAGLKAGELASQFVRRAGDAVIDAKEAGCDRVVVRD